jgi:exosome complex component RRP40
MLPCALPHQRQHFVKTTMAASATIVLPGDNIAKSALPTGTGKKKTLTLGPGLRHTPPDTVTATVAGALVTDNKKNAASVEYNSGRVRALFLLLNRTC